MQPVLEDGEAKNAVKVKVQKDDFHDFSSYSSMAAKKRLDIRAVLRLVKRDWDLRTALKEESRGKKFMYIVYLVWKNFQNEVFFEELGILYSVAPTLKISAVECQGDSMIVFISYKNLLLGSFPKKIVDMKLADEIS